MVNFIIVKCDYKHHDDVTVKVYPVYHSVGESVMTLPKNGVCIFSFNCSFVIEVYLNLHQGI